MLKRGWREEIWSQLDKPFEVVIIGGGITGAGIFLESVRAGLRTLLLEAHDFASGTSSRSSKLVHGGFRYLRNGQIKITFESVRERERLLRENRGLINQLGFVIACYKGDRIPMWALGLGLTFYDLIGLKWSHKYYDSEGLLDLCPHLNSNELCGGYRYIDALTDDARLVLRTILDGVRLGGLALNYAKVERIISSKSGRISGVQVVDLVSKQKSRQVEIKSKVVINATGAWMEHLSGTNRNLFPKNLPKIRRLRGSHLVFAAEKLPVNRAISIWHPKDKRPVFTFPWESVSVIGTTDVDYCDQMMTDPCISNQEVEYLLDAVRFTFPSLDLDIDDVQSTFSGIRSVVDTGKKNPSQESREHFIRFENGLMVIGGGKLTTFQLMASQALNLIKREIPELEYRKAVSNTSASVDPSFLSEAPIDPRTKLRLLGRYGNVAAEVIANCDPSEFSFVRSSPNLWVELRWAAQSEGIVHLEDLLLRRVRLGTLLPNGGIEVIERIKAIVKQEMGWDENLWEMELRDYKVLLEKSYSMKFL